MRTEQLRQILLRGKNLRRRKWLLLEELDSIMGRWEGQCQPKEKATSGRWLC